MNVILLAASDPQALRVVQGTEGVPPHFEPLGFRDNDPAKKGTTSGGMPAIGGFEVLGEHVGDDSDLLHQMSAFHEPSSVRGARYDDLAFGIRWPTTRERIPSERDRGLPLFEPAPGA